MGEMGERETECVIHKCTSSSATYIAQTRLQSVGELHALYCYTR